MSRYRFALTGTPITNTPESLWPTLNFLSPEEWPSRTSFIERYCHSTFNHFGGLEIFGLKTETKEEFFSIFEPRYRRMPKEVILPNLPPIQRLRRYVTMSSKQAKGYRTMAESMVAQTEGGGLVIAQNPVSQMTRLVQYSSACIEMEEGRARLTDPSCKLDQLLVDLPDFLESGESVVVFAVSRQLIEMAERRLEKAGIGYRSIKGGQSADERHNSIDTFQSGQVPIICVVVAAGGVGITLTRARVAIFLQLPWSNVDYEQACGRVHRIGSEVHESVLIVNYLTEETIEEYQLSSLEGKAQRLEEVVRDKEAIKRLLKGG